jgi:hypothetical protein
MSALLAYCAREANPVDGLFDAGWRGDAFPAVMRETGQLLRVLTCRVVDG